MSLFEQKSLLAKLMATENMIIRQANVSTASFDILNRVLTVPVLDRNLSKEVYDLFMGHETGHALWTPLEGMRKAKAEKVNMSVMNVVEDSRIERKIKNKYPGIKTPFIKAYGELYERNFFETDGKDLTEYNFVDRVNLHCKIGASLALPFSEEERKMLDEVESTETFDDVIEVTKKICDFMKEQLIEEEVIKQKIKIKIIVDDEQGEDQGAGQPESTESEDSDDDSDITIVVATQKSEKDDVKSEKPEPKKEKQSEEPRNEENESSSSGQPGQGAGIDMQQIQEQIHSFTDDAFKRNESNLFSNEKNLYVYGNIPKYDVSKIMDYKDMFRLLREESYTADPMYFNSYRRESSKVVSYLVKEFELRKNADQMKRASTAKTGDLNMNRLYAYTLTDDIFKKMTVVPQGKSHGLVMFLDWSGSMSKHLANTVKQLLNLTMFCKKVNIPFEVYSFIDGTNHEYMHHQTGKTGDLRMSNFGLINLLSNRMSASDFTFAASVLMKMSGAHDALRRYNIRPPSFMYLSGTPLNEAVIAAMEIVPQFQKRNKLQVVNTVFLTDGEGSPIASIFESDSYAQGKSFTHMVIRDPKTRHEEVYERNSQYYSGQAQTDCLIRLLKIRTNSHVIGFFVGESKDISNRISYFFPEYNKMEISERYEFRDKLKDEFRKNSSMVVTSTGFDDYYILRSNGLDTDDDEELTFKENATTRGMASAFSKFASNKISSRVVLNRFIELIA